MAGESEIPAFGRQLSGRIDSLEETDKLLVGQETGLSTSPRGDDGGIAG